MFDAGVMGKRIRLLRKQMNLTQEELAAQVGVSLSFMGHIERGTRQPSLDHLVRLSKALGVSTDFLLTGSMDLSITREQAHMLWDVAHSLGLTLEGLKEDGREE